MADSKRKHTPNLNPTDPNYVAPSAPQTAAGAKGGKSGAATDANESGGTSETDNQ